MSTWAVGIPVVFFYFWRRISDQEPAASGAKLHPLLTIIILVSIGDIHAMAACLLWHRGYHGH
jgi:hypothetical protein